MMKRRYLLTMFLSSFTAALGAGYFMGANHNRGVVNRLMPLIEATSTSATTDQASVAATTTDQPAVNQDQTYIVKKGETLYSIGKQLGLSWPALAAVNNLTETSLLKEGQVLRIPTADQAKTVQIREYKVTPTDDEKQNLQTAQDYANAGTGQLAYRLVPAQVVQRSPLLSRFAFSDNDLYIEKSKDTTKGEAVVEVTHDGKLYSVYLTQALVKGDKGVWTITKVMY